MYRTIFFISLILFLSLGFYVSAMPVLIPNNEEDLESSESEIEKKMIPLFGFPDSEGRFSAPWLDAWMDQSFTYMDWEDLMGLSYIVIHDGMPLSYDFVNTDQNWLDHKMLKAETVPVPGSVLLLGSGIVTLAGLRIRKKNKGV
jgi:hypothetical protein